MNIVDLVVFLIFTVGTIMFGYLFGRKKQSSEEFTRGGGKVPGWVVGLSIFASFCSSISFLGYCSSAFMGNWNAFVFTISILPAGLLAMRYFVPFYRSLGSISAYSFFEKRFGRWARLYASVFYLFTQVCRSGAILFLLAVPMNVLMGWSIPLVALLRGQAAACSITEITQKAGSLIFTLEKVELEAISALVQQDPGRMLFSPSEKPAITLKLKKGEDPLRMASQAVERYAQITQAGEK